MPNPKYDNFVLVFAGNRKEFKTYIQMLIEKEWVLRFDILSSNTAMIGTSRGKLVLFRYVAKEGDHIGAKFKDPRTEVVTTGTWFNHKWIANTLERLRDMYPDLKFKSAYIKTKS